MQDMFSLSAVLIFGATGGIGQHVVMEFAKAVLILLLSGGQKKMLKMLLRKLKA